MDGLTIGYGEGDVESTTNSKSNESTMYAKYAFGSATVGIQVSEADWELELIQSQLEWVFHTKQMMT